MICLTWSPLTGGLGESYHPWRAVALTASRSDLGSAEPAADLGQQVHLFVTGAKACCRGRRFALFAELLGQVSTLRSRTGRPHWLIVDEAHHLLPSERADVVQTVPEEIPAAIFIAVHPESVSRNALKNVAVVLALGDSAPAAIKAFCNALGIAEPSGVTKPNLQEIVYWPRYLDDPPRIIKPDRPRQARKRHTRKYAEGDLGEERSFYFKGPDALLNLRAQNLVIFLQLAQGVDDRAWEHHLRRGEYSAWFRDVIKDDELAIETAQIEAALGS